MVNVNQADNTCSNKTVELLSIALSNICTMSIIKTLEKCYSESTKKTSIDVFSHVSYALAK